MSSFHHDVTTFDVNGMVSNIKKVLSQEWNMTSSRIKNILKSCLKYYIFRNYQFLAEVNFK